MGNDNIIDEKKLIEAIKISANLPKIQQEYDIILPQVKVSEIRETIITHKIIY